MSGDLSCNQYNSIIQENINNIAKNTENLRDWSRDNETNPNPLISLCFQEQII